MRSDAEAQRPRDDATQYAIQTYSVTRRDRLKRSWRDGRVAARAAARRTPTAMMGKRKWRRVHGADDPSFRRVCVRVVALYGVRRSVLTTTTTDINLRV